MVGNKFNKMAYGKLATPTQKCQGTITLHLNVINQSWSVVVLGFRDRNASQLSRTRLIVITVDYNSTYTLRCIEGSVICFFCSLRKLYFTIPEGRLQYCTHSSLNVSLSYHNNTNMKCGSGGSCDFHDSSARRLQGRADDHYCFTVVKLHNCRAPNVITSTTFSRALPDSLQSFP